MTMEKEEKSLDKKDRSGSNHRVSATALLSERVLSREWLKPEEEEAWGYL
jgi:hypothetical protein